MKKYLYVIPYFILIVLPIAGIFEKGCDLSALFWSERRLGLLWNSVRLAGVSSFLCVLTGFFAALGLRSRFWAGKSRRWFFMLLSPVPFYIYSLSFIYIVRFIGRYSISFMQKTAAGFIPCMFINLLSFLPLSTGAILISLEHFNKDAEDMGRVYSAYLRGILSILIPGLAPIMGSVFTIIFSLIITDYSVSSLFQYPTYTLEIFTEFSRNGDTSNSGLYALIISIPIALLLALSIAQVDKYTSGWGTARKDAISLSGGTKILSIAGLLLCAFQVASPMIIFIIESDGIGNMIEVLTGNIEELINSVVISVMAGILAVLIAGIALIGIVKINRPKLVLGLGLFPLAVPSSLIAIGLLKIVNGSAITFIQRSIIWPAIGCVCKYIPVALLILYAYDRRKNIKEIELGAIYMKGRWSYVKNILIPVYFPAVMMALGIVSILSFGEESIGIVMMPPGRQLLAVKMFNYLHYGASDYVCCFGLINLVLMAIIMGLLFTQLSNHNRID